MTRSVVKAGTLPPLEADDVQEGAPSDLLISFVKASLPKVSAFTWWTYSYRYYNEDSVKQFRNWIIPERWEDVIGAEGSQE